MTRGGYTLGTLTVRGGGGGGGCVFEGLFGEVGWLGGFGRFVLRLHFNCLLWTKVRHTRHDNNTSELPFL